jgi:hypothetical protein
MEVVQNHIQGGASLKDKVIDFEAAREKSLLRKARSYREPHKHIKIISTFFRRHPLPPLTQEELARITNQLPLPPLYSGKEHAETRALEIPLVRKRIHPELKGNVIDLQAVRQKLQSEPEMWGWDRRKWLEVAKENGWGDNPRVIAS